MRIENRDSHLFPPIDGPTVPRVKRRMVSVPNFRRAKIGGCPYFLR
jgi:hypothetical protein